MNTVDGLLNRNLRAEAEKRGYIVIAPAAPNGELFFESGARIFPEFLKLILADYKIRDGKFHIAGPSNGGIAAFHVAAANPQYFLSVTAFPGYMWQPTAAKLQAISKLCVFMYVGENDDYMWHDEMKREAEFLRGKGAVARYTVEKGQPHRIETLAGASASRLFDNFDETEKAAVSKGSLMRDASRRDAMRHLIALTAVLYLSWPTPAAAQLVAPNATGVAMGHVHVFARDVEAMRQFLRLLGGEPTQNGTLQRSDFPAPT